MGKNTFSNITLMVVQALTISFFQAILLFLLWNLGLAEELGAKPLTFAFFFCGSLFIRILLYSPQLVNISRMFADLYFMILTYTPRNSPNSKKEEKKDENTP